MHITYILTHNYIKYHGRYDKLDLKADHLLVGYVVGDCYSNHPVDLTRSARSSAIIRSPTDLEKFAETSVKCTVNRAY